MKHLVFTYGTLKKGYGNNRLLANEEFVGKATTKPLYRLYNLGAFPGLIEDEKTGKIIHGELWRISDKTMRRLDLLEGHPNFYRREFLEIEGVDGVQGYIFNGDIKHCEECSPSWDG